MRTFISFLVLSVLMCGVAASAEQGQPATEEQILQELRELRKAVADLKGEVAALQARMDKQAEPTRPAWSDWSWGSDAWDSQANWQVLAEIKLPENPTKEQAREYVAAIMAASRDQRSFSSTDPQVQMLARVGPENVDVLVQAAGGDFMADVHIVPAICRLARPEHKDLILEALPCAPELVQAVIARGWLEDAKEILVEGLRYNPGHLPTEWVEAVASFKDPDTYDELIHYFVYGSDRPDTYRVIKDLPGIELSDAVAEAWRRSSLSEWEAAGMAPVAIEWGHLDALAYAVSALTSTPQANRLSYEVWELWLAVLRHTDAPRSLEGLGRWFEEDKDNLVFDPETKKFRVKGAE